MPQQPHWSEFERNVVTLSHLDRELHEWLKKEALRRTQLGGPKVHTYQLVEEAVRLLQAKSCAATTREPVAAVSS